MSAESNQLVATLRSLGVRGLKEVATANRFSQILDRHVYNALFPQGMPGQTDGMLNEDSWDENDTLMALACRASDRPLRAWLGVAVDHGMVSETMANAIFKALREQFGPLSEGTRSKQKTVSPTSPTPTSPPKPFATLPSTPERIAMGNLRVCRQCRRDHQRCDRAQGKQCKRCLEHGWNCAESVPKSPTSGKRKRTEEDVSANEMAFDSPLPAMQVHANEFEEEGERPPLRCCDRCVNEGVLCEAPSVGSEPCQGCIASGTNCSFCESPAGQNVRRVSPFHPPSHTHRRSTSAASSTKSRPSRQRSLSSASKDEKPTFRELRSLEREKERAAANVSASRRRRQSSAIDVALDQLGLRKTAANLAFLTEAGLISPDMDESKRMDDIEEASDDNDGIEEDTVRMNRDRGDAVDPVSRSGSRPQSGHTRNTSRDHHVNDDVDRKPEDDDAESAASTHDEYSFFGGSAVGTPATISDPHFTRETSVPISAPPLASGSNKASMNPDAVIES